MRRRWTTMEPAFSLAIFIIYTSVLCCVSGTLRNLDFHPLNLTSSSNSLIDKRFGVVDPANSTSYVNEGRASLIIHPKKQFWIEQVARKLAPFFSVVSFWNEKCWTTGYDQGTCFSKKECIAKGGTPNGMCAAGFGVCCVFSYSCDSATAFNRTYFMNPEFPYTIHEFGICPHSILKLQNICQIRLDFEVLELARPNKHGHCEEDMFTIQGTDFNMPPLCGDLTGHHLYLPVGYDAKITMRISLLSGNPWARWKIRTTKIKCSSNTQAPPGCQQHLHGVGGRITSFNYYQGEESNINHLNYGVCVRKERGFCAIQWTLCNHGERKRRSVKSPGVTPFDVRSQGEVTSPGFNQASSGNTLKTTSLAKDHSSSLFSISRSYSGIHVSGPNQYEEGCKGGWKLRDGVLQNSSLLHMIACPGEKEAIKRRDYSPPPTDAWRPFVPPPNYYAAENKPQPQQPSKLERRTLEVQIGSEDQPHVWRNGLAFEGVSSNGGRVQVNEPINWNPPPANKNPSQDQVPIRRTNKYGEVYPVRAYGSESTFTPHSNTIPNGNQLQFHHRREGLHKPHLKSGKDSASYYGIGEKVLGIKIPFYSQSKPSATASASVQAQGSVNIKPGHQLPGLPGPTHLNPKPIFSETGYLPPINTHPKPIHGNTGYIPPVNVNPKPIHGNTGYIPPVNVHPKPIHSNTGYIPPVNVNPKPPLVAGGGVGALAPIGVKPKPSFLGAGALKPIGVNPKPILAGATLLKPGKVKVNPKPLAHNGFGLLGRPKVKPKPTLQYKPWGHKNKNKGNGTCKPKLILVPVPIPLPIPIPIPIVPVVVVPFPFGGGGGGGEDPGHGWGEEDKHDDHHHKVISATEPYIIRIVTDDERDEGLSSFCMDWEQIPCDIWWTQNSNFPEHNEL